MRFIECYFGVRAFRRGERLRSRRVEFRVWADGGFVGMLSKGIGPAWACCTDGFTAVVLFGQLADNVCVFWRARVRRGSAFEDATDV